MATLLTIVLVVLFCLGAFNAFQAFANKDSRNGMMWLFVLLVIGLVWYYLLGDRVDIMLR